MAIEIVICIYLDQANAIGEISRVRPGWLYRHSSVTLAMNDDDRACRRNGLKIAKPIQVKIISDGNLFLKMHRGQLAQRQLFPIVQVASP